MFKFYIHTLNTSTKQDWVHEEDNSHYKSPYHCWGECNLQIIYINIIYIHPIDFINTGDVYISMEKSIESFRHKQQVYIGASRGKFPHLSAVIQYEWIDTF